MKFKLNILLTLIFLSLTFQKNTGQTLSQSILSAISDGNATELAKHFNSSIELIIINNEAVYSKSQAEQIIKKFFSNHPPSRFTVIHEGGKEVSKFAIGTLNCGSKSYRVTIFLSKNTLIHQLRIEPDDV